MGFLRGSLVVFLSSILFLVLFLGNILLTFSWSLEYETLQPNLQEFTSEVVEDFGGLEMVEEIYEPMKENCSEYDSFNISEQGINLSIPCEEIMKGPEEVVSYSTNEIIKQIYFKDYSCDFWKCLKTEGQPYVIVSEKAQEYWNSKYFFSLLSAIILFILIFLLIEKKQSAITLTGILIILSSLPFKKVNWLLGLLPDGQITDVISLFFTKASNVFVVMFTIGIIILLVGLAFEIFGLGLKISKLFGIRPKEETEEKTEEETFTKKEVKEIVKEEIKKEKKKEEKMEENKIEKLTDIKTENKPKKKK